MIYDINRRWWWYTQQGIAENTKNMYSWVRRTKDNGANKSLESISKLANEFFAPSVRSEIKLDYFVTGVCYGSRIGALKESTSHRMKWQSLCVCNSTMSGKSKGRSKNSRSRR